MNNRIKYWINSIYLFLRRFLTLFLLVPGGVLLHCWISIFKNIPAAQVYMNLGSQFMRTGVGVKIGDQIHRPRKDLQGIRSMWVKNLYYNFGLNKVTASYTDKPHTIKKNEGRR
ncbi:MAG: hypothetical protein JJE55_06905 [Flavobacteriaceae bacterium]|nr:hypothetical protein [Flavobacteriaceae bacterium]